MPSSKAHLKTLLHPNLPETIYFDSSFIVRTLVSGLPYHQECVDFIRRLVVAQPYVVVSKISYPELWCAAIRISIDNLIAKQEKAIQKIATLTKKKNITVDNLLYFYPNLISKFHSEAEQIHADFRNLLQRFTYRLIEDVNDAILTISLSLMQKYNLGSYDAVHIATMDYWKLKDLATFDHSMEDIAQLNIWTCGGSRRYNARWYKRSLLPTSP